jgi:hypothetical protein
MFAYNRNCFHQFVLSLPQFELLRKNGVNRVAVVVGWLVGGKFASSSATVQFEGTFAQQVKHFVKNLF